MARLICIVMTEGEPMPRSLKAQAMAEVADVDFQADTNEVYDYICARVNVTPQNLNVIRDLFRALRRAAQ